MSAEQENIDVKRINKELVEALEEALYSIKALDEDYDIRPFYINGMQALTKAKGSQV